MIKHYCGIDVDAFTMLDLDRLGINCSVKRNGETFKVGRGGGGAAGSWARRARSGKRVPVAREFGYDGSHVASQAYRSAVRSNAWHLG